MINLKNNKVIVIHKGFNGKINLGTIHREPIEKFIEQLNNNIQINKDMNKYEEQKLKLIIDNTNESNKLKKKNKNIKFDNNLNKNNEITLIYDFKKLDDDFIERVKKKLGETISKKNYLVTILLRIIKITVN